jgi:hypothetical protein
MLMNDHLEKGNLDTSKIYPDFSKPATQPENIKSKRTNKNWFSTFIAEIGMYFLGLLAIVGIAFIFGVFVGGALVSHASEYFGGLADAFSIIIVGPVLLFVFGIISLVRSDWIFLTYPFVVFSVIGPKIYESSVSDALAIKLPFNVDEGARSSNRYLATAILSYALVFTVEHCLSKLAKRGRFKTDNHSRAVEFSQIGILSAVLLAAVVSPVMAHKVISDNHVFIHSVRMPRTADFIAANTQTNSDSSFELYYRKPTNQYTGSYNMNDMVLYKILPQGENRDIKKVCGQKHLLYTGATESYPVTYQKTSNGLEYGIYIFPRNGSQPPRKTLAYSEYHTCFILDDKQYDLERTDAHGNDYLNKYPTSKIVAAFADAKSYINCTSENRDCSKEDIAATTRANKIQIPSAPVNESPDINPYSYKQVRSIDIKEWGIRIPLSEEAKDLYYSPPAKAESFIYAGLESVSGKDCYAGYKQGVKGVGTVYIVRELKSTVDAQKHSSTKFIEPNKQVGDYVYAAYASGNAKSCMGEDRSFTLGDSLDWSTVNIDPL